jgi:hypothetical protein
MPALLPRWRSSEATAIHALVSIPRAGNRQVRATSTSGSYSSLVERRSLEGVAFGTLMVENRAARLNDSGTGNPGDRCFPTAEVPRVRTR